MPMSLLEFKQLLETLESFKVVTDWMLLSASTPASSPQRTKHSPSSQPTSPRRRISWCAASPPREDSAKRPQSVLLLSELFLNQARAQLLEGLNQFDSSVVTRSTDRAKKESTRERGRRRVGRCRSF